MSDEKREAARKRVAEWLDNGSHKFKAGPDGKDPRDEKTRSDDLRDPKLNKEK